MDVFQVFFCLVMLVVGMIFGVFVAGLAEMFGVAGWILGAVFISLFLGYTHLRNRMRDAEMDFLGRLLARLGGVEARPVVSDEGDKENPYAEPLALLLGTAIGIVLSLIWSPGAVMEALPI